MEEDVQTLSTNATSALLPHLNTTTSLMTNPLLNNTTNLNITKTLPNTAVGQDQQWDETITVVSPPVLPCQQIA
jgi:hypothetical protein